LNHYTRNMNKIIFIFSLFFFGQNIVFAQYDLAFYCDVMTNAAESKNRITAGDAFKNAFIAELKKENSFSKTFSDLKWVSVKGDENKTFRIITWQVKNEKGRLMNNGLIQTKDGAITMLADAAEMTKDIEYEVTDATQWLGAIYYNVMETNTPNGKAYLLFGYNGASDNDRAKIMDVLSFEKGIPIFGAEIFKISDGDRPDIKTRVIVQYSALATVNFNYSDAMGMIVHDYVVSRMGIRDDGQAAAIPDGTYVGYKHEGKYWKRIDKIENQITDPKDVILQTKKTEVEKKDIFGRPKK
jgi:hypothetical protein